MDLVGSGSFISMSSLDWFDGGDGRLSRKFLSGSIVLWINVVRETLLGILFGVFPDCWIGVPGEVVPLLLVLEGDILNDVELLFGVVILLELDDELLHEEVLEVELEAEIVLETELCDVLCDMLELLEWLDLTDFVVDLWLLLMEFIMSQSLSLSLSLSLSYFLL
jgi:hypothetical protein